MAEVCVFAAFAVDFERLALLDLVPSVKRSSSCTISSPALLMHQLSSFSSWTNRISFSVSNHSFYIHTV